MPTVAAVHPVSQIELAEIQELQSRIASDSYALAQKWRSVRASLQKGAQIEHGPIRAWLESKVQLSSKHRRKKIKQRMVVR